MVACAGVTLRAVATAMGVTIRGGTIVAEGIWDARGTLAIDRNTPVGLTEVALKFDVDCDADATKLERMIQTTERYCVILQTLKTPPKLGIHRQVKDGTAPIIRFQGSSALVGVQGAKPPDGV